MLRTLLQNFWYFGLWLLLLGLEQSWGLPLLSLAFCALQLTTLDYTSRMVMWVIMAYLVSVMYVLPLSISLLLIFGLVALLEVEQLPYKHKSKFFLAAIICSGIVVTAVLRIRMTSAFLMLHLIESGILFIILKYWFERKEYRRFVGAPQPISWKKR